MWSLLNVNVISINDTVMGVDFGPAPIAILELNLVLMEFNFCLDSYICSADVEQAQLGEG